MKRKTIYNLCYGKNTDKYWLEEHLGWADEENKVGYYKTDSGLWKITDLETGAKYSDDCFQTRKDAVNAYNNTKEKIKDAKANRFKEKVEFLKQKFEELMEEKNNAKST